MGESVIVRAIALTTVHRCSCEAEEVVPLLPKLSRAEFGPEGGHDAQCERGAAPVFGHDPRHGLARQAVDQLPARVHVRHLGLAVLVRVGWLSVAAPSLELGSVRGGSGLGKLGLETLFTRRHARRRRRWSRGTARAGGTHGAGSAAAVGCSHGHRGGLLGRLLLLLLLLLLLVLSNGVVGRAKRTQRSSVFLVRELGL